MTLTSHGWVNWEEVLRLTDGATALWLEPTRYQCGPLPQAMPVTTLVHAWSGQRCWRLRPEGSLTLVTELHPGDSGANSITVRVGEPTEVQPWSATKTETEPGPVPEGLPRRLLRLEVLRQGTHDAGEVLVPVSFLRAE